MRRLVARAAAHERAERVDVGPDPDARGPRAQPRRARSHRRRPRPRPGCRCRSAWNCIRKRFAVAPPSTRRTLGCDGEDVEHVGDLVGDRLERRPREMRAGRPARQPADQPARVGVPVRRAETRQRGHEVDALRRIDRLGEPLGLGRALDHAEAVAQPLHRGTADEDGALGGELGRRPRCDGRSRLQQPVRCRVRERPDVREHERSGAVRRLRLAGGEAPLTEECSLLVSGHARERDGRAEQAHLGHDAGRGDDGRQHGTVDGEEVEELVVPALRRTRSSNMVREAFVTSVTWASASGQLPGEPGVDRPEGQLLLRRLAVPEDPLELARGEVRDRRGARSARARGAAGSCAQRAAVRRSCHTIARCTGRPLRRSQTTVVSRWFVIATAVEIACRDPGVRESRLGGEEDTRPDLLGIVLDPARARGSTGRSRSTRDRPVGGNRRRRGRSCRSCPGRSARITRSPMSRRIEGQVDAVDELVGPASRWSGSVPRTARHRTPALFAAAIPASVSSKATRLRGSTPSRSSAVRYPSGCGFPCRTSSAATIVVSSEARPAASTTGSISARNAPETTATGTRAAA